MKKKRRRYGLHLSLCFSVLPFLFLFLWCFSIIILSFLSFVITSINSFCSSHLLTLPFISPYITVFNRPKKKKRYQNSYLKKNMRRQSCQSQFLFVKDKFTKDFGSAEEKTWSWQLSEGKTNRSDTKEWATLKGYKCI